MAEHVISIIKDPEERIAAALLILQEYAKWEICREYVISLAGEAGKRELLQVFFITGRELKMTERDMTFLLFNEVLNFSSET